MLPADPAASRSAYEAWHRRVHSADATADRPWHELLFAHVRECDLAGRTVLEIGCGRGELACRLALGPWQPHRIVAADFASSAVTLGRARGAAAGARIEWLVADIQRIPLDNGSVDTVISCETIEHLPDPAAALRELYRVVRPGGRLLLTTPNYTGTFGLYRAYLRLRGRPYTEGDQPISRFMVLPRTLQLVRRAGFRVMSADASGHYLLWPGRLPWEPAILKRAGRWLWPFGLHSIVVAEKR